MCFYINMTVNQVSSSVGTSYGPRFSDFKQPQYGYYIQPDNFTAEKTPEDKIDKKKLWMRIGFGVLLACLTSVGIVKSMPKSVIKKFDKFKQYLEKKIEKETTDSKAAVFYRTMLKTSLSIGEKCQGINNVIPFKDIWFKRKVSDKISPLKKACNTVTKWFDNISKFTVHQSYKSTGKKFNSLDELLQNFEREILVKDKGVRISIGGETKTAAEWVKILAAKRALVGSQFSGNFSRGKVDERFGEMQKLMSGLEDKVWAASFGDKSNFAKKDTYFTFVADKFLAVDKAKFGQGIHNIRSQISYNIYDQVKASREMLAMSKKVLNPKDSLSEKIFRDLNKQFSALLACDKHSPQYAKLQEEILENLGAFKKSVVSGSEQYKYDDKIIDAVGEHTRFIREILMSDKKGQLDEMLEIYEKLLDENDFVKLKKEVRGTVKSLDNSINNEAVEYFDKLRDLELGSAPTDILSMILGFGSLGIGLAQADDKDTQASIALKYGIPAIGGMLTSMVMTSMLVSGGKSLALGFLSTILLNKAGVMTDEFRKKRAANNANANAAANVSANVAAAQ